METTHALPLFWSNRNRNIRYNAGVAFYNDKYGEYRLKIDLFPYAEIYLKPVSSSDNSFHFRVELIVKRNNKFFKRSSIGHGDFTPQTNGNIQIYIGPLYGTLLLPLNTED